MRYYFLLIPLFLFFSLQSVAQKHPEDDVYSKTQLGGPGLSGYFNVPVKRETDHKDVHGTYIVPAYYHIYGDENEICFYNFVRINIIVREVYLRITINDNDHEIVEAWKGKITWGQGKGVSLSKLKQGGIYYLNFYTEDNKLVYSQPFEKASTKSN